MELRTEDLKKVFRTDVVETVALNGVSIDIHDGEFVAIMGPSGCGKSTLLNILGMLDTPTDGTYWLEGREVSKLKEDDRTAYRRGKIGFHAVLHGTIGVLQLVQGAQALRQEITKALGIAQVSGVGAILALHAGGQEPILVL